MFDKYARSRFAPNARVLEIGPDDVPSTFQRIVGDASITWETLDQSVSIHQSLLPQLTYLATDEYAFPIDDARYDIVLSAQVIEHVRETWRWMEEVARVCRPGGTVITIAPVSWPYHEDPVDCWRIYPEGLRALYQSAGLDTELALCATLEPQPDLRREKWFLAKQTVKSFLGREPFLDPVAQKASTTVDTIAIARKA